MNRFNTYLACAVLAASLLIAIGARAQETDRHFMIGAGIAPVSVTSSSLKVESSPEQHGTLVRSGLAGQAQLAAGIGLGPWVLAIETAFIYSAAHDEDTDVALAETNVTKRTDFMIGPGARFLFIEGAVRPFVEAGAGIGLAAVDGPGPSSEGTLLYVRGGPGVQLRLADSVSLDLTLRVAYSTMSGAIDFRIPSIGQSEGNPDAGGIDFGVDSLEYTLRQLSADLAASLSVWL